MTPGRPLHAARRALRDTRGAAAVEFAFVSTILLLLITGGFDLSHAIDGKRDTQRASAEISNTLAQCTTTDCVLKNGQAMDAAKANVMPTMPGATFGWAMVSRVSGTVVVDFGNMPVLASDVNAQALKVLANDNDNAVCVLVTYNSAATGIFGNWMTGFGQFRSYACSLQSRNQKII